MSLPESSAGADRLHETRPIGYLGWDGNGNLGDDAIREALARALPHLRLVPVPLTARALSRFVVHPQAHQIRRMHLLLGGGTVIGRRNWRLPLTVDLALCGQKPAFMVGAGVEDPSFQGRHSFSKNRELARWKGVLGAFDRITVRGPRSAQLLADIGVDAEVVGDPALLLGFPAASGRDVTVDEGLIGLNLGFGSDLWSHDQGRVVDQVGRALHDLSDQRHYRFRFLVVNEEDRCWTHRCVAEAGLSPDRYDVRTTLSPERFIEAIEDCSVVVAQRLHAGILAAAIGIPIVMLEYQPKCHDFMESIGQTTWSIRTDTIDKSVLLDRVLALVESRTVEKERLNRAVQALQAKLTEEVGRLVALTTAR